MCYLVLGDDAAAGSAAAAALKRVGHEVLVCSAEPAVVQAVRGRIAVLAAALVSGHPAAELRDEPRWRPLLRELSRQVLPVVPSGSHGVGRAPGTVVAGGTSGVVGARGVDGFDGANGDSWLNGGDGWLAAGDLWLDDGGQWLAEVLAAVEEPLVRRLAELIDGIGRGRRSPSLAGLELLAAYERLDRLGRPLNAVATAAPIVDPAAGPLSGLLGGGPVAVKDIIAVAGLPTRCGSPASDPAPAAHDAALVGRLRRAGAEVLAASQCLEYAAGFAHPGIGDTRNPRDPSRTSGGSSGGSAALVAAGVCDLAIGTDTGGSIRIPAAYCGVVGFKPSYGAIPVDGVFPLAPSCDHAGTLTAGVDGAAALFGVLADPGPDVAPGGDLILGLLPQQLADPSVTSEVRASILAAVDRLAAAGWQLRELTAPWLDQLPAWEDTLTTIVAREAAAVHRGRDQSRYAGGTRALLAFGAGVSDREYEHARERAAELTTAVDACLDGVAALAGPTVGYPAPEQDPPFGTDTGHGEGRFTGPYNLSGHPAVSLPVPAPGLPAGLQLAGRRGGDRALLEVAAAAMSVLGRQEP